MSFKIPCGGFRLDEKSFSLDENGVLSVSGGGSIPKPLTYDYMPEGYPKMVEFTGTLMEQQSVPNEYTMTNPIVPIEGKTYTVNFDGTNYNCICHRCELIEEGGTKPEYIYFYIGNPAALDIPGETSELNEPFLYYYEIIPSIDNHAVGFWYFYDGAESHTVAVQGTGIKTITILPSFLPTGDDSPYELKEVGTKKVYVAEYNVNDTSTISDRIERLHNEVSTAWSNGYYVLLYYYGYNNMSNPQIYNLSEAVAGTYYFSRIEMDDINNAAEIRTIKLYRSSDGQYNVDLGRYHPYYADIKEDAPLSLYLKSSGAQQKLFSITVDDSGTIKATAVT